MGNSFVPLADNQVKTYGTVIIFKLKLIRIAISVMFERFIYALVKQGQ